ncbi:uncharacterized protein [Palaemon carinicauda]|uniref:uncharacterized protein n=1 Tax=Palaemon carinicauda TaxID=392227 RepID=UPI0035B65E2B
MERTNLDLGIDDPNSGTNIVTLEYYSCHVKNYHKNLLEKKREKVRSNDRTEKYRKAEILPGHYEEENYDKFLILEFENGRHEHVNVFKANREISRGVIYAPELLEQEEKEIENELRDQGGVKVLRMRKRVGEQRVSLATLVLTFDQCRLPSAIKAGWLSLKVKPYIPSPLRCYHCQMYGHLSQKCKEKLNNKPSVCANGGKNSHGACMESPCCIHCGEAHPEISKSCVKFIFEKEIQAIRTMGRVTFKEARKRSLEKQVLEERQDTWKPSGSKESSEHLLEEQNKDNLKQPASFEKILSPAKSVVNIDINTSLDNTNMEEDSPLPETVNHPKENKKRETARKY